MATAETVTSAILQYISNNAYPDSEAISSASLDPSTLASLSQELAKAQDAVKADIQSISRDASGDIDTWISRAKELQQDILRSRDTARQIVEEAERTKELKEQVRDRRGKVELLEREVRFQEGVRERLDKIGAARGRIDGVQSKLVEGDVLGALAGLEDAESIVKKLGTGESGVCAVLARRTEHLRDRLQEMVKAGWAEKIQVQIEGRSVTLKQDGLDDLVTAATKLELFHEMVDSLGRDFQRAILRPRMAADRNGRAPAIHASAGQLVCSGSNEESTIHDVIRDLTTILEFLVNNLPRSVASPLSEKLLPGLITKLEEEWLQPAIPLDVKEMPAFQRVLDITTAFCDTIERLGFSGGEPLREWVETAARSWLTKRREALLVDVRNLVFVGVRKTTIVERVETQTINEGDDLVQGQEGGDEDWDTAWDEPEETPQPGSQVEQPPVSTEDDDDTSAWDVEDDDETAKDDEAAGDDAWGWGDGDDDGATAQPSVTPASQQPAPVVNGDKKSAKREVTLRETFTVTSVPDGILELLQKVIADAQTLAGPEYASTPIAPAAAALYTLPTLGLAIYRATATTAYNKLPTGNILIYNDANRLSDQLRSWQAAQPPASRLRLDNDVKALDDFAKRAYTAEMESQRTILNDLLDGAQGFSNCTAQPYKGECQSAVEQTTDRLREVHKQWTSILSSSALLQSTGSLLSSVISKMIREIEDLPDIGEEESKQLKSLCDHISSARDLFMQTSPEGELRDMTFIYCPNWLKFQYLAEILESSLADIKFLWGEGELSLEFGAEEVVGLIEALFAESALRRGAIGEIRRGGRGR